MRTPIINKEHVDNANIPGALRRWWIIDAADLPLGRAATRVATVLRGKHKPQFTPHVDMGDFVIVVNAEKVMLTGRKMDQKMYYRHSGWPGGLKQESAKQLIARKPAEVMRHAVKGMLPKTRLGRQMIKKLKIYVGPDHPHQAQQPQSLSI
jgi:large subunit ribosomal protein L13